MSFPPLVAPIAHLSDDERARTARHAALAGFGDVAQRRLAAAHVAVVGAGGLGSPAVMALAAAGVGHITVIDDDDVEHSNLHRQIMHRHLDVGAPKVASAVRVAEDLSPHTVLTPRRVRLTAGNARAELSGADIVIDGTDTFETRNAVARACEDLGMPLVWATLQGFDAQVTVFWSAPPPGFSPIILSDLYPEGSVGEVPTCADVGVLGALCLQVGGLLSIETIKLLTGIGEPLLGRVLIIDSLRARQTEVPLSPSRARQMSPAVHSTELNAASPSADRALGVESLDVAQTLAAQASGSVLLDVREPSETRTGTIPGVQLLPLAELLASPERAGQGPFVVVCEAGARARRAALALQNVGIEASILTGGMTSWRAGVPRTKVAS